MPVRDGAHFLARSISALQRSSFQDFELIVVDDGSQDDLSRAIAPFDAVVLSTGGGKGAAAARNLGAERASAPILVFVDADVMPRKDALAKIAGRFEAEPSLSAIMGAYDDAPDARSVVSRFRNLLHAYVHRRGNTSAETFWTGLGAVRREAFDAMGGFSRRQILEDVEFGMRLREAGREIALDPSIQGTHLKRWTLGSMIRTDILKRGAPWILLALERGGLDDDLNATWAQRASVAAAGVLCVAATAAGVIHGLAFIAPAIALAVLMSLPAWRDDDARRPDLPALAGLSIAVAAAALLLLGARAPFAGLALGFAGLAAALYVAPGAPRRSRAFHRLLAAAIAVACGLVAMSFPVSLATAIAALAWGLQLWLNRGFLQFLARRMGALQALAGAPLLLLYHLCCAVSVVVGAAWRFAEKMEGAGSACHESRAR